MRNRIRTRIGASAVALSLLVLPSLARAQTESAGWSVPRTADGRPDLQGVWANNSATPVERPEVLGDQATFTDEELATLEARYNETFAAGDTDAAFADSVFKALLEGQTEFTSEDAATGNYNQFWLADRELDNRTSLIVDPPNGRLPALTPEAIRLTKARADHLAANPASSWTDRRLSERCVTFGLPNLFAGYNTYYQIVQTADYVVLLHEMIHDARVIPLDGRPHLEGIRQWFGNARGHWEGDTLVVETENFLARAESPAPLYTRQRGSAQELRLVERFTRVDADTLEHVFTVQDPGTYTQPWTAMVPLKRSDDAVYEYACHEGNIAMEGMLAGHRAQEEEAGR